MDQDRDRERGRNCCTCYLSFIFSAGLTSLSSYGSAFVPTNPNAQFQNFYIPALNKILNSRLNTTLSFMVRLDNPNRDQRIFYDNVHLTFSNTNTTKTKSSADLLFVGNYTVPKFYQGHKKKAKKWGQILPLNNQTVLRAVFRLNLNTHGEIQDSFFWKTKRYRIEVGADIEVNGDGVKANKKAIKMNKSDSSFSSDYKISERNHN